MKKSSWITILIIVGVIILAYFLINRKYDAVSKEDAVCIGQNSELYIQLGCHACEIQQKMFGSNYKYLNLTDCWFDKEACISKEIDRTPTWIIAGKKIVGVQSIEILKELTGC